MPIENEKTLRSVGAIGSSLDEAGCRDENLSAKAKHMKHFRNEDFDSEERGIGKCLR